MLFFTFLQNLQENTCAGLLFLTKIMAVKRISATGCFWRFSRTENLAHVIRCIWPKFLKVYFLNFLYDHKDHANFDNAFSVILKNFPEPTGLETNSSLQDSNKSKHSDWERDVLNLKRNGAKIVKNLFFRTALLILFSNCDGTCPQIPKLSLFKSAIRVWCFAES